MAIAHLCCPRMGLNGIDWWSQNNYFSCVNCNFLTGLKTYLISGLKVKEPLCSCSQTLLPGLEAGDRNKLHGASSAENIGDLAKGFRQSEKSKVCLIHQFPLFSEAVWPETCFRTETWDTWLSRIRNSGFIQVNKCNGWWEKIAKFICIGTLSNCRVRGAAME